jgi:tRNA (guanine-N7-)-methyltransferase
VTKGKLEKFAEMKTFPNVIEPDFKEIFQKDYKLKGKWSSSFFKNDKPLILELGCGKGEYTVNLAWNNPNSNYLGIDIKGARMWKGAKIALNNNLQNAGFLRTRIDFINSFFDENEVDEIWVTFPDPQPKKPKKRLISSRFLNAYAEFIKADAPIRLKTDNADLFAYAKQVIDKNNLQVIKSSEDVHNSTDEELQLVRDIQTFYEKQFVEMGKTIKYISFCLNSSKTLEEPDEE